MRMHVNLLSVGLLVLLLSLSISAQSVCEKTTKERHVQYARIGEYSMAAAPDSLFEFPLADYVDKYVVLSSLVLRDGGPFGPQLFLRVNYCDENTRQLVKYEEMHPGSSSGNGVGFPNIVYYGPIAAPDNIRCLSVGIKEEKFSSLNTLLFSGVRSAPEALLFKRVLSRQMSVSKAGVVGSVKPRVSAKVGVNNPSPLNEPEVDPKAQASCYASVAFVAD